MTGYFYITTSGVGYSVRMENRYVLSDNVRIILLTCLKKRLPQKKKKLQWLKQQKLRTARKRLQKKNRKVDVHGDAHINATFNNIIIALTNKTGQVISWSSAGKMGFKRF